MWEKHKGFTIVELLIVVVVIAILAAIIFVGYKGIQNRAYDASVTSDLESFAKKIELQKVDLGTYPQTLTSAMGFGFSKGSYGKDYQNTTLRYCYNPANDNYILIAVSKSGNYFSSLNSVVGATANNYGWSVCSQIGLTNTNPSQNGFEESANPQWATWTN